jgi:phosphoribosylamine--glycine ligase
VKVLVVGSGGREHALAWALARSPSVERVWIAPGNGGTERVGENLPVPADDLDGIVKAATERRVDLVVVGPEAPLVKGVADRLLEAGIPCFGPSREAARLEGSKVFAKTFMAECGIPTADFRVCEDPESALEAVEERGAPVVVKADGLAAGKGAIVARTVEEAREAVRAIMVERRFGESGRRVVVEECLVGKELSVQAICAGRSYLLLPPSQDHKRVFDGDRGPNTGGMGAYAPVPFVDEATLREVEEKIVRPVLDRMAARGTPFSGVLYAGLMLTAEGPKVLEFNVRFGDPETQALLPLVEGDLGELLSGAARGRLPEDVGIAPGRWAATVVMASRGYPGRYPKGFPIEGIEEVEALDRTVFHAGTRREGDRWVTAGGRVLAVSAWADSLERALRRAYEGVEAIRFEGAHFRRDVGRQGVEATS